MRPRIKRRVNVSQVVEALERKHKVYTEAIKDVMAEEKISYSEAKSLLNLRLREKVAFKF